MNNIKYEYENTYSRSIGGYEIELKTDIGIAGCPYTLVRWIKKYKGKKYYLFGPIVDKIKKEHLFTLDYDFNYYKYDNNFINHIFNEAYAQIRHMEFIEFNF